jgi:hypothetical protein
VEVEHESFQGRQPIPGLSKAELTKKIRSGPTARFWPNSGTIFLTTTWLPYRQRRCSLWLDTTNIYPGDDFLEEMKKGIRAADKIIICLSPSFNKKPPVSWVKKELKMAMLRESENGQGIIIPVRIKSGGSIPEEIGTKAYADLSTKNRWNRNLPRLIAAIKRFG